MATSLLDVDGFRERTIVPPEDIDLLESMRPGFLAKRLEHWSSRIRARLRKRYSLYTPDNVPDVVIGWLVDIVTVDVYHGRGWNASDAQAADIRKAREEALTELQESANGENGLLELPQSASADDESGVSQGGPYVYSESDPYEWMDVEREARRGR